MKRSTRPSRRTIKGGSADGCAPAAASRFRNSDSIQTLSKLGNAGNTVEGMWRGVWARSSGTRGCGILPATVALVRLQDGGYHVGFTVDLGISGCETFFTCYMRRASQTLERRVGWTWLDSGRPAPKRLPRTLTFLILLCSRSGHKTGIDVAVREAIACIGWEASHQWHDKQTGRSRAV